MSSAHLVRGANLTDVTRPVKRMPGQHHGDLRNVLLSAALELVAESGPRGFSVAEAARRAGVSSAAPYKHFADRDALLAALAVQGYAEQERRFAAALSEAPADVVDRLVAVARAYVSFAAQERALFDVVFGAGLDKAEHADVAAASRSSGAAGASASAARKRRSCSSSPRTASAASRASRSAKCLYGAALLTPARRAASATENPRGPRSATSSRAAASRALRRSPWCWPRRRLTGAVMPGRLATLTR